MKKLKAFMEELPEIKDDQPEEIKEGDSKMQQP